LTATLATGFATTAGVLFLVFVVAVAAGAAADLLVLAAGALTGFVAGFTAATLVFAAGTGFAGIGDKVFAFEGCFAAATGLAATLGLATDLGLVGGAAGAAFWGFAADFAPGFVLDGAGLVDFGDGILQPQNKKSVRLTRPGFTKCKTTAGHSRVAGFGYSQARWWANIWLAVLAVGWPV